ncbi:MAG: DUF5107 domain-containing protein [Oscillospiraceae bacterium]|nr:DUF5107 domain-containing protein [Oscillospiraceae bacterium]
MSSLRFEKLVIPSADFGGESSLPLLTLNINNRGKKTLGNFPEDEEMFFNYGRIYDAFPYREQNLYGRELYDTEYDVAYLENENLKAMFIPALGGKMWSLIDKRTGKELLFRNSVIRPCNLAVRNAWTSGGVEWNMGFLGHSPMTCSLVNTAETKLSDGTPVLRFYWFERIRCCIAQMDIFLPDGSEVLYVRTRITNPNEDTAPMYWWSNIATVQEEGARVIVPAEETYLSRDGGYYIESIPYYNGVDVTYPLNSKNAYDYFWKTKSDSLKYICQLDKNGYGLATSSTDILRGRKLFVWGDSQGGRRWQNYLTADGEDGSYNEIQIGLARTQLECLPMPPRTVWEWVETYGAMQADKEKVHGEWKAAREEVEGIFAKSITKSFLETVLSDTREMAKASAKSVFENEGWASLEILRREKSGERDIMCDHLSFAETDEMQKNWISLLENGTVGEHDTKEVPASYQIREEWLNLLYDAIDGKDSDNWYAYYLLGAAETAKGNLRAAKPLLEKSIELTESAWAYYVLGIIAKLENCEDDYASHMLSAFKNRNDDISLAKAVFRCLYETKKSEKTVELYNIASESVKKNERCMLFYAYALTRIGDIDEAEKIIVNGGKYITVADIREGETITSELWDAIREKRGGDAPELPRELDFRMQYNEVKKG